MKPTVPPARRFVPQELDLADWSQIEPVILNLCDRAIHSPAELEAWLADVSELYAAVDESGARKYIAKSCHTDDAAIEAAFMKHVEEIEPKFKPLFFELQKKFIASPHRSALKGNRYVMLTRNWQAEVELFRPENVDLETQVTKLVNEYDKIFGSMMVKFRGKEYTPQFMGRFMKDPDRKMREEAWTATAYERLKHRETIDDLFDQILAIRQQIAVNAGFKNYRDYAYRMLKRFDYGPPECDAFANAVEKAANPVIRDLEAKRKKELNLDTLRPWDMDVDPQNRAPLKPFEPSDIDGFVAKTRAIFDRISPSLATDFDKLRGGGSLDLDSRKGKQPGGYQSSLEESKQPFIFMNATGLQSDVRTLLHEGGHAFHYQWASAKEPLVFLRAAPTEFCEVASMAMELLGMDHFDLFYGEGEDNGRAKREQLEGTVPVLAWIATIDRFQDWIYTHVGHTRDDRTAEWNRLMKRFGSHVDWTGYEQIRDARWQAQLHLFHVPFYYIEYGIAQLGALQLWLKSQNDVHGALANYRAGLSLGGTEPLPKLFATSGLQFDFSLKTVEPLMKTVREELAALD
jgi:oligoendopeptidase F